VISQTGQISSTLHPHSLSWSPSGNYLAAVDYTTNGTGSMTVYEVLSGVPINIGLSVGGLVLPSSVSWSPNGQYLAEVNTGIGGFGATNGSMNVYSVSSGGVPSSSPVGQVPSLNFPALVSWSPDGQYLVEAILVVLIQTLEP